LPLQHSSQYRLCFPFYVYLQGQIPPMWSFLFGCHFWLLCLPAMCLSFGHSNFF
jgi:hypothetical protein